MEKENISGHVKWNAVENQGHTIIYFNIKCPSMEDPMGYTLEFGWTRMNKLNNKTGLYFFALV